MRGRNRDVNSIDRAGRLLEEDRYTGAVDSTPDEKTLYTYDDSSSLPTAQRLGLGRLVQTDEYALQGGTMTLVRSEHSTFDPITGQVATTTTPEGTLHHAYDPATGQLQVTWTGSATDPAAPSGITTQTAYGYDQQGRLEHVYAFKSGGSSQGTYTGWNSTTQEPTYTGSPLLASYTYDRVGNLLTVTQPNGVVTSYDYDSLNRLYHVLVSSGSRNIFEQTYTLAHDGQRTQVIEKRWNDSGSAISALVKTTWNYADGRLTGETLSSSDSSQNHADSFTFDLASNRISKSHTGPGGGASESISYSYNAQDQLTGENSSVNGATAYYFDPNGSQTSSSHGGQTTTYRFDVRNKMAAFSGPSGSAAYVYNDAGQRVRETTGGVTTYYLTDTANPTGYAQPIEARTSPTGSPAMTYLLGDRVLGQATSAGAVSYLLTDGHGSTRLLLNAAGAIASVFNYDAFGGALNFTAASAGTVFLFGGDAIYDAVSGLYLHGDGIRGRLGFRFIEADEARYGNANEPMSLHKYLYASANPISRFDPDGHMDLVDVATSSVTGDILAYSGMIGGYVNTTMSHADNAVNFNIGFSAATTDTMVAFGRVSGFFAGAWAGIVTFLDNFTFHGSLLPFGGEALHEYRGSLWSQLSMSSTENTTDTVAWIGVAAFSAAMIVDGMGAAKAQECFKGCFVAGTPVLMGTGQENSIEQIHVGQRVATDGGVANSADGKAAADPNATAVTPKTWRMLRIIAGDWQIETLAPVSWIKEHHAAANHAIRLADVVDVAEMGVSDDLIGNIESVSACPKIQSGPGRVVLTTVTHLNSFVFDLTLRGDNGGLDTIGITGGHGIYTEDLGWVNAGQLRMGETVRTAYGDVTVAGLVRQPGVYRIYNMTVEADHVYYVGGFSALAHNVWCDGWHHVEPQYLGGARNGATVKLEGQIHQFVHQLVDKGLREEWGEGVRSMGRNSKLWDQFLETPEMKARALEIARDALADVLRYVRY